MASLDINEEKTLTEKLDMADRISSSINRKFGKRVMGRIGANPEIADRLEIKFIPTACPELNAAVGGGFPRRRCTIIAGLPDSGKTSIVLETIGQRMEEDPSFVALWVESENSLKEEYLINTFRIDPERFAVINVDAGTNVEEILDCLAESLKTGAFDICCINSLKSLVPAAEMESSLGNSQVGVQARMNGRLSRKLNAIVAENNTAFIIITHLSTLIGTMSRDPLAISGGYAIQYWSQLTLDFRKKSIGPGDPITKEEGIKIGVTVRKNHCMPDRFPYVKFEYYALFGQGIEKILTALDTAVKEGIVTVSGAWIREYDENGEEKNRWNGKQAFRNYMLENPAEFKAFSEKVYGLSVKNLEGEELETLLEEEKEMQKLTEPEKGRKAGGRKGA